MKEIELTRPVGAKAPSEEEMGAAALRQLGLPKGSKVSCVLAKRSLDARKDPVYRYRIEVYAEGEDYEPYRLPELRNVSEDAPTVAVVGAGPAGMFAALKLLCLGVRPVVLERGKDVHARKRDMATLSRTGVVDPESNYCFGEGGAGAFSDGKLYTRSSKRGDNREVLCRLVEFGASPDILVDAHPHIGSDRLPAVVENIRRAVVAHGGEYRFGAKVVGIRPAETAGNGAPAGGFEVRCADGTAVLASKVILATGHSARDIYEMLETGGGALEAKGFALGVRVEHPQEKINWLRFHGQWRPGMGAAEYSFVQQVDGRGVFSFCMCPGGILVPSATEAETVVLNGMSNSARNGRLANAGVVVQLEPEDVPGSGAMRLMDFQRSVEREMFRGAREALENGFWRSPGAESNLSAAPAQRMEDFCLGRLSKTLPESSYHPGVVSAPLHELLPQAVSSRLRKAFPTVPMKGYFTNAALLLGVESRTSSPVRIPRDPETLEYLSMGGIYPCGEGAGYSGGIVSSAIDGIRCAEAAAAAL